MNCPNHTFNCKEFNAVYTKYEAKFPPPSQDDDNAEQEGGKSTTIMDEYKATDFD